MAIVVVNEMAGGDQNMYDEVSPQTMPGGQLPDGCSLRLASPVDGGWRVITVWESQEQFEAFRDGTLIPAIQEAGYGDRVSPKLDVRPVYDLITA